MSQFDSMSDREWAKLLSQACRESCDLFLGVALNTPYPDHEESALDYADFLDNTAYTLEQLIDKPGKNSRRKLRNMRVVLSDSVLMAIDGHYQFLNQWVLGEGTRDPEYPEFVID